ncbi:hypothetical protein MAR621_03108 [Maribacter dokdonensis]|uniref:hypothetical protein n=1 Tax=Maribacter dokdonensis TaxID=320912 RepID=UPI001B112743|nr:hypothetical protein [Maribacter dokdonensis]CAG2532914.1 hypothetical protein MAR621_03108 [Maribacter dokdonensis]
MYENIFNIDFYRLVAQMLPLRRRRAQFMHWLFCLVEPIVQLHQQFMQFRDRTNYKLAHTPQVFSIENVLNDAFDRVQRRIFIEDGEFTFPVYFYDRTENKPVFFFDRADNEPVRFYDRKALGQLGVDFTIVLPNGLVISDAEMIRLQALVDFYKLPDKTYTVTYG